MKKAKAKKRKSKKARKSSLTCCRKKRELKRVKKRKMKERVGKTAASSENSEKDTTGRTSTDSKSGRRVMHRKCQESTPSQVIRHKYSTKSHRIETLDENKETSERENLPNTSSSRSEVKSLFPIHRLVLHTMLASLDSERKD